MEATYHVVDIASVGTLLKGSALTDDTLDVPDGHYAADTMSVTAVPNRNAIMLSIGFSVAAAENADIVAIGVHDGNHFIYPDCRPQLIDRFAFMEQASLGEYAHVDILAPFVTMSKADIVKVGAGIGVPFEEAWSCYKGEALHCGTCGTCVERKQAFAVADIHDPTRYQG